MQSHLGRLKRGQLRRRVAGSPTGVKEPHHTSASTAATQAMSKEQAQPNRMEGGRPSDTRAVTLLANQAQPDKGGDERPSDTRAVTRLAAQAQPNKMGSGRPSDTRAVTRLAAQQQNKTK